MQDKYAIVVTTVNAPTRAVKEISQNLYRLDAHFVIVGDAASPEDFEQAGADYLDLDRQAKTGFYLASVAPKKHYSRKNIGYLYAIQNGATIIVETDDDNIPTSEFWSPRQILQSGPLFKDMGWLNVYNLFSDSLVWPRGLPLNRVKDAVPELEVAPIVELACPIQQGLADGDPDVDAIYRLLFFLPITFKKRNPVLLNGKTRCPFNSQNTTWWRQAFALLYLPSYCSFRMTDIWRSFVAQRIAQTNDWSLSFHNATMFQQRNEHNLMTDFEEEVSGYLRNEEIVNVLDALVLEKGMSNLGANMRKCYRALIDLGVVGEKETDLLEAWIMDMQILKVII